MTGEQNKNRSVQNKVEIIIAMPLNSLNRSVFSINFREAEIKFSPVRVCTQNVYNVHTKTVHSTGIVFLGYGTVLTVLNEVFAVFNERSRVFHLPNNCQVNTHHKDCRWQSEKGCFIFEHGSKKKNAADGRTFSTKLITKSRFIDLNDGSSFWFVGGG